MEWIESLLSSAYFRPCELHAGGVTNIFHLDSGCALCPACAAKQAPSSLLQIRRSSYHEVVRVVEIGRLLDTAGVQSYLINQARVLFLNQRPQPRAAKAGRAPGAPKHNACLNCCRNLQSDVAIYCSIACKVAQVGAANCALQAEPRAGAGAGVAGAEVPRVATEGDVLDDTPRLSKRPRLAVQPVSGRPSPVTPAACVARPLSRRKGMPRRSPDF